MPAFKVCGGIFFARRRPCLHIPRIRRNSRAQVEFEIAFDGLQFGSQFGNFEVDEESCAALHGGEVGRVARECWQAAARRRRCTRSQNKRGKAPRAQSAIGLRPVDAPQAQVADQVAKTSLTAEALSAHGKSNYCAASLRLCGEYFNCSTSRKPATPSNRTAVRPP